MTKKEFQKLNKTVAHAGVSHNKKKAIRTAMDIATHDIARSDEVKATRRSNFRRRLEEWTGIPGDRDPVPHVLPHERRVARLFAISGVVAIVLEAVLAIPLSMRMGLPWWTGVVIAVLTAIVLHGGLTMAFRRTQRPRETYSVLKRWLLIPSFALAIISLLVLLMARAARGWLLLMLLPLLTVSLWTATAGLLILGAALLVASDIYNWATKDAAEYAAIDREQRRTTNYRREWQEDLEEIERHEQPLASVPQTSSTSSNGSGSSATAQIARILPVAIVGVLLTLATACQTTGGATTNSPRPDATARQSTPERSVDIHVDASLSGDENAYRQTARNLHHALPQIIERWNVRRLTVFQFSDDGWRGEQRLRVELPQLTLPQPANYDAGEFEGVGSVEEAKREQAESERAQGEAQALQTYRSELGNALTPLTEQTLQPPVRLQGATGARCTELFGLLRRVSVSTGSRIVIVITDGHDTCSSQINPIPAPDGEVTLIIVLVPENQVNGQRGFELRRSQLAAVCPWAEIVPYFSDDFNATLTEAMSKRPPEQQPANR